ncbi:MAG TPA: hypothetical protein EYP56_04180 [Planctomycetaceae bacterium]|nr:hypothetical protein [Planctomycetaceae bacterium]
MLKLIGQLLIWGSLAGGALAAANAYLVSLDLPDEELVGLTLAAPAGRVEKPGESPRPLADKDAKVTPELLAQLRGAGVKAIRVKEFQLRRWQARWYFLLAVAGLLAGAWASRRAGRGRAEAAAETADRRVASPAGLLAQMQESVEQLASETSAMAYRPGALGVIVHELGQLQRSQIPAFGEARQQLAGQLGMRRMAAVMDSFAAAERQINRAWSAAVDEADDEALRCLREAAELLAETRRRLGQSGSA